MARDFNGASHTLTYSSLHSTQYPASIESYAFWIYPDSVAQWKRVHHFGTSGDRYRTAEMDDGINGFVFNFDFTSGGAFYVAKPSTGSWQHYTVTFDGTSTSNVPVIYKNGVSQSVTVWSAPSGTIKTGSTTLNIGSDQGSSQWWDGRIAEYGRWNRILTQAEATSLAAGYAPSFFPQDLVFYLPLIGQNTPDIDLIRGTTPSTTGPAKIAHPDNIRYPLGFGNNKRSVAGGNGMSFSGEAL